MSTASNTIKWAIYSPTAKCFWSEELGWVSSPDSATIYTDKEKQKLSLPSGGRWLRADAR
jgi:hypothetical protein